MTDRSNLRQYYKEEANNALSLKQYQQRTAQLDALEDTLVKAFNTLIRFMDGKTTKTEVVNQLKSISTPDVDKVVSALTKLDASILANKLDLNPLLQALNSVKREVSLIPKTHAKFEQKDSIKVTNLDEVKLDTSEVVKAINGLKLDPKIDVKSPIVNIDKPDLRPLQDIMIDLLKAVRNQKFEMPEFPEIPKTDLSKVEKKLDESNKHLKEIAEKRFVGGGGGGGHGTPYVNENDKASYVTLSDGAVPVVNAVITERYDYTDSTTIYTAHAVLGTLDASLGWTITKYDLSDTSNASGKVATDVSWVNRATGTFL